MVADDFADRIPTRGELESLNRPVGEAALVLPGGLFRCTFAGLSDSLEERFRRRWRVPTYRGFEGPGKEIRVDVVHAGADRFLAQPPVERRPEEYRLEGSAEAGDRLFWSYDFAFRFDPAEGRGKLALCRTDPVHAEGAVENTLRLLVAWEAVEAGGILIHSAGVRRNGESYLFFGPSGAGKTTVAGLSGVEHVLHDDLCMVLPAESGYRAAGFPFLGEDRKHLPMRQEFLPVAGFYRLVQSGRVGLDALSGAAAAGEVFGSLPFVTDNPETSATALGNAARITAGIPVFRLSFRRDPSFWEAVDRERSDRG